MAYRVVAEIAGEAAAKPGQAGARRCLEAAHVLAQEDEGIAVEALDDAAAILDLDMPAADANADLRRQADERIAAETLAADHGFEQKRVALIAKLEVERQRRVQIRERLEHQRNAIEAFRRQRTELGFGDHAVDSREAAAAALRMAEIVAL